MSLIDKAKQKARENEEAKAEKDKLLKEASNRLNKELEKLTDSFFLGLSELHNAEVKRGVLALTGYPSDKSFAILKLIYPDTSDVNLLYIRSQIKSGQRSLCDEYIESYTEPTIEVYTYNFSNNYSNFNTNDYNQELFKLGLTKFNIDITHEKDIASSLEKIAEWLAPLFESK